MSFHEVLFPERIAYGAVGGPKFKTTVMSLASGYEKRNIDWSKVRHEYDVSYGLKTQAELEEIREFFYARKGKAYGFLFKDWADYKLAQSIGSTNGSQAAFQIFKRYDDSAALYDRNLTKIKASGFQISVGATVLGPGNFTLNATTGIVTLDNSFATTTAQSVVVTCEFYVPVRFDTDHLATVLEDFNVFSWGGIPLVEVRI